MAASIAKATERAEERKAALVEGLLGADADEGFVAGDDDEIRQMLGSLFVGFDIDPEEFDQLLRERQRMGFLAALAGGPGPGMLATSQIIDGILIGLLYAEERAE